MDHFVCAIKPLFGGKQKWLENNKNAIMNYCLFVWRLYPEAQ
jgi:hypothetical protein